MIEDDGSPLHVDLGPRRRVKTRRVREHNQRETIKLARAYALETERVTRARAAFRLLEIGARVFDVAGFLWLVYVITYFLLHVFTYFVHGA